MANITGQPPTSSGTIAYSPSPTSRNHHRSSSSYRRGGRRALRWPAPGTSMGFDLAALEWEAATTVAAAWIGEPTPEAHEHAAETGRNREPQRRSVGLPAIFSCSDRRVEARAPIGPPRSPNRRCSSLRKNQRRRRVGSWHLRPPRTYKGWPRQAREGEIGARVTAALFILTGKAKATTTN